jgi:hypothetical protein
VLGNVSNHVRKYGRAAKERYEKHVIKGGKNVLGNVGTAVRKIRTCMIRNVGTAY